MKILPQLLWPWLTEVRVRELELSSLNTERPSMTWIKEKCFTTAPKCTTQQLGVAAEQPHTPVQLDRTHTRPDWNVVSLHRAAAVQNQKGEFLCQHQRVRNPILDPKRCISGTLMSLRYPEAHWASLNPFNKLNQRLDKPSGHAVMSQEAEQHRHKRSNWVSFMGEFWRKLPKWHEKIWIIKHDGTTERNNPGNSVFLTFYEKKKKNTNVWPNVVREWYNMYMM